MNNFIINIKGVLGLIKTGDFLTLYRALKRRIISNKKSFGLKRDITIPYNYTDPELNLSIRLF